MKDKEQRFIKPEYRIKQEAGKQTIQGYAAVFNSLSEDLGGFREKIAPGAFKNALGKSDARALFNHDYNHVLGRQGAGTLRLKENPDGLFMEVDLPDTQLGRDLAVLIERGDVHQQSFGFTIKSDMWEENRETKEVIRTLLEIDQLYDVSPVTFPAYPDTSVAKRSMQDWKEKAPETRAENKPAETSFKDDEIINKIERILKKHENSN